MSTEIGDSQCTPLQKNHADLLHKYRQIKQSIEQLEQSGRRSFAKEAREGLDVLLKEFDRFNEKYRGSVIALVQCFAPGGVPDSVVSANTHFDERGRVRYAGNLRTLGGEFAQLVCEVDELEVSGDVVNLPQLERLSRQLNGSLQGDLRTLSAPKLTEVKGARIVGISHLDVPNLTSAGVLNLRSSGPISVEATALEECTTLLITNETSAVTPGDDRSSETTTAQPERSGTSGVERLINLPNLKKGRSGLRADISITGSGNYRVKVENCPEFDSIILKSVDRVVMETAAEVRAKQLDVDIMSVGEVSFPNLVSLKGNLRAKDMTRAFNEVLPKLTQVGWDKGYLSSLLVHPDNAESVQKAVEAGTLSIDGGWYPLYEVPPEASIKERLSVIYKKLEVASPQQVRFLHRIGLHALLLSEGREPKRELAVENENNQLELDFQLEERFTAKRQNVHNQKRNPDIVLRYDDVIRTYPIPPTEDDFTTVTIDDTEVTVLCPEFILFCWCMEKTTFGNVEYLIRLSSEDIQDLTNLIEQYGERLDTKRLQGYFS